MSNAPSKPVSFSRPKVGYFSNRPRTLVQSFHVSHSVAISLRVIISRKKSVPELNDQPTYIIDARSSKCEIMKYIC